MKKFLSPEPGGGVPLTNELLYILQNEPFSAIQALYGTVAASWIVSGCTTNYNLFSGGTTCTLSAGYVFLGGELREVDTVTSTFPFYIIAAPDTYDQKQFGNGAVQNVYVNKRATITTVQPTGGSFLTVNPTTKDDTVTKRLRPLLNGDVLAALAAETQARIDGDNLLTQSIINEAQARAQADTTLQNNINNLASQVAQKQNRVTIKIGWQDVFGTLGGNNVNPYYTTSDNANDPSRISDSGAPFQKFQMMRTEDGIVHVRGYVRGNGGGYVLSSQALPPELRPPAPVHFTMTYATQGNNVYPGAVVTAHTLEFDQYGGIYHTQRMSQIIDSNRDPAGHQIIGFHPWFFISGSYSVE